MKVEKRDGRIENYDERKITKAIMGAALDVGIEEIPRIRLCTDPPGYTFDKDIVTVDEIHDEVERQLMEVNPAVAKAYILYRQHRTDIREGKSELMGKVGKLVEEMNHDNANTGNSAASKMYGIAEAASKTYFLAHEPKKMAENHKKGRIYQHDLGYRSLTFNCFFNPLGKMLRNGFDNGVGRIRPPKRIGSAVALAAIILQSSQNDMFGGQGFLHFDTDLALYVKKEFDYQWKLILHTLNRWADNQIDIDRITNEEIDSLAWKRTDKAVFQAMEAFVYNMNTMRSRSGAQVTFSSVNFGTDTSDEARMISKNLLKAYIAGLGDGENPIFPNLCYRIQKGVNLNPGDPNFDITELAIECVGKRIQPRFVFVDSPAYPDKWEAGTMGCRTAIRSNINGDASPDARGNIAFNTINLPYLALEAKEKADKTGESKTTVFFEILKEAVQDAIDELVDRYKIVCNLKVKDIPFIGQWYMGHEGLTSEDTIEPMVKNGTLSVGFIGLAETLNVLVGKHHGQSELAQTLGLKIVGFIREQTDRATKELHLNFSTFATPAESACYTLMKAIRKEFGDVKGVTERDYLTNSFHLPVSFECDMKTKIDIEAPYHLLCNAGAIMYVEAPSSPKFNPKGVLKLIQYMAKSGAVYGGLNFEQSFCRKCHYTGTYGDTCPKCGSKDIRTVRIITGYLSEVQRFNPGKAAESSERYAHAGGALN